MSGIVELNVGEALAGQRLDNFILRHYRKVPKSLVYKNIRKGQIRVNGKRKKAEYRLVAEDIVRLPNLENIIGVESSKTNIDSEDKIRYEGEFSSSILFEDDYLICLNKKSGWAVHSGSGVRSGVIERLRELRPEAQYLELAHRLDRGTSGCLLIMKSREALLGVQRQLKEKGDMTKWYSALCFNHAPFSANAIYDCTLKVTTSKGEQSAHSRFEIIEQHDDSVLFDIELLTGRKHQIRQHCAALGVPIMGDNQYGDFAKNKMLPRELRKRLMLHAHTIEFIHPIKGLPLRLEAPLPAEFQLENVRFNK